MYNNTGESLQGQVNALLKEKITRKTVILFCYGKSIDELESSIETHDFDFFFPELHFYFC